MVLFKNKYGEMRSGWVLGMAILAMFISQNIITFVVEFVIVTIHGGDLDRVREVAVLPAVSYLMQYSISLGGIGAILLLFCLVYKRPFRQMGLIGNRWFIQLLWGCLYGIILISIIVILLVASGNAYIDNMEFGRILTMQFLFCLIFFIFVGFFEEILCRGLMMTALKTTRSKWIIVLCPAIIFGLLHATNPNVTIFSIINITIGGVMFGYLMIKKGNLWVPIGVHITWNFFLGNVFGIPVSGNRDFSVMETVFTGNDWITGGEFGAEGGVVCTGVLLLFLAYIHFFMKSPKQDSWTLESDMPLVRGASLPSSYDTD